jgi:hypothetical protein
LSRDQDIHQERCWRIGDSHYLGRFFGLTCAARFSVISSNFLCFLC